jgi:hypothetical protein
MNMEPKDLLTLVGLVATLGLGIYNFLASQRSAQRTSIVGSVTAQRLKWGTEMQDSVASFCAVAHYCRLSTVAASEEGRKKIEEIERLRTLIVLKLCERTPIETDVEKLVEKIVSMSFANSPGSDDDFRAKLLQLIQKTQDLLRENWASVASEAKTGVLATNIVPGSAAPVKQLKLNT